MQNYIIDTNVLYYLAGLSVPESIDVELLKSKLHGFSLSLSELTLLELFTHPGFSTSQYQLAFKYISDNKIRIINFFPIDQTFLTIIAFNFADQEFVSHIKSIALLKRIDFEKKLLSAVINSTVAIMSFYYHYEAANDDIKRKIIAHTSALIGSNLRFLNDLLNRILNDFYNDSISESSFKQKIRSISLTFMIALSINNNLSKNNILITELDNVIRQKDARLHAYRDDLRNDRILKKIYDKVQNNDLHGILSKKECWSHLDNSMSDYMKALSLIHNEAVAKYFGRLLNKIFKADKRIEKNSLIDSQFLEYYPQYYTITFDSDLTESFESIDKQHFDFLSNLQNTVKNA